MEPPDPAGLEDRFGRALDVLGVATGDLVLIELTQRVKDSIRTYDLFGRYGGEEFILLIDEINEQGIIKNTERIRRKVCETPMLLNDLKLDITASFGIAPVIKNEGLEKAISLADEALYKAKRNGKNRVEV